MSIDFYGSEPEIVRQLAAEFPGLAIADRGRVPRDAALRAQYRKLQESLIAPATAAEEHAAELAQGPEAALGDDPIGMMEHTPETVEDFEGDTEA